MEDNSLIELDARSFDAECYLAYLRLLPADNLTWLLVILTEEENFERAAFVQTVIEERSCLIKSTV